MFIKQQASGGVFSKSHFWGQILRNDIAMKNVLNGKAEEQIRILEMNWS